MKGKDSYGPGPNDPAKLLVLIRDTEVGIASFSQSLPTASNQELQEMPDATCVLRILKSHPLAGSVSTRRTEVAAHADQQAPTAT